MLACMFLSNWVEMLNLHPNFTTAKHIHVSTYAHACKSHPTLFHQKEKRKRAIPQYTMEATIIHLVSLLLLLLLLSHGAFTAGDVVDTFSTGRNITDNDTLVSADGTFTLGFFSPGASTKRYLGFLFTVSRDAVCWAGFKIYRRNFGVFFVFGPHRLLVYRCFPVFFVLNFKNFKKFINNYQKNWEKIW